MGKMIKMLLVATVVMSASFAYGQGTPAAKPATATAKPADKKDTKKKGGKKKPAKKADTKAPAGK